jgi:hypothetical protein
MKTTLLLSLLLSGFAAFAADGTLKNFQPGTYSLKTGNLVQCGAGEFEVRDNGTNLALGPMHAFDLNNEAVSRQGDTPGDEECIYEAKNAMDVQAAKTVLTFTSTRKCKETVKSVLTEVAEVEEGKVKLDVKQTGTPTMHYACRWTRNKSKR